VRSDQSALAGGPTTSADRRRARRRLAGSLIRTGLVLAVLIGAYALAPLGSRPEGTVAAQLVLWLLASFVVVAWQVRAVSRSSYPGLRAIGAIAVSVPLFVLVFASAYFVSGRIDAGSFNEPLSRLDAVYFATTVFATVGFGDIVARTDAARILVTLQMLLDLVLIGVIAKVLFGAVQRRRQDLGKGPSAPGGTGSPA
jgi:voltage-gated potassium channel